jgi:hypothetical protein
VKTLAASTGCAVRVPLLCAACWQWAELPFQI